MNTMNDHHLSLLAANFLITTAKDSSDLPYIWPRLHQPYWEALHGRRCQCQGSQNKHGPERDKQVV